MREILLKAKEYLYEGHNSSNILRHFSGKLTDGQMAKLAAFLDNGGNPHLDVKMIDSSDGWNEYQVVKVKGKWVCDCKGFAFRGKCRHTSAA